MSTSGRYNCGWLRSVEDVARELGVSEPTARALVSRGLRRLGVVLEPYLNQLGEAVG